MTTERIEEWFSANYLDGDDVQKGQMLSSEECLDAVTRAHQAGIDEERVNIKEMVQEIDGRMYFDNERLREYIKDKK